MQTFESAHGHIHQPHQGHAHALVQQQHSSNGASVARSKHLTVNIAEDPTRSLSASPGPGGAHSDVETNSYLNDPPSSGEGEGMESQFGRAPKSAKSSGSGAGSAKRKAAPRTSRACLACRRQKMRCEGADNPPCKRCVANEVDCMFERRSDYLLNPEDRAWQNGVEKRLEHLSRAVDQMLLHMQTGGPIMTSAFGIGGPAGPHTAASYPGAELGHPGTAYYDHMGGFDHRPPGTAGGVQMMPPNTAPLGGGGAPLGGMGRINYVIPQPGETAAVAAARAGANGHGPPTHMAGMAPPVSAGLKRARGSTVPGGLPSAGFGSPGHPDTSTFALFSPRTGGLDTAGLGSSSSGGLGQPPYAYTSTNGAFEVQHSYPNHSHEGMQEQGGEGRRESPGIGRGHSTVPRSLHSPVVRFAPTPMQQQQQAQGSGNSRSDPSPLSGPSHRAGEEEVAA